MHFDAIELDQAPIIPGKPRPLNEPIRVTDPNEPRGGQGRPYESWRHKVLTRTVAGGIFPALKEDLGFTAWSAILHNYSTAWLFVPAAQVYVPPKTHGFIAMLHQGTQQAEVYGERPPAGAASVFTDGHSFVAIFTELQLTLTGGTFA